MTERQEVPGTVTDARGQDRDRALATVADRAVRMAPGLRVDTGRLAGPPAQAVTRSGAGALMLVVGSRGIGAFTADSLAFACEEAALRQASLTVVHAWRPPQSDRSRAGEAFAAPREFQAEAAIASQLAELLDRWRAKYPDVPISQEIVHGHPGRTLVGLSARAGLLVIGRHARHPGAPGLGAVTHAVLNHAHGPVVTVPSGLDQVCP